MTTSADRHIPDMPNLVRARELLEKTADCLISELASGDLPDPWKRQRVAGALVEVYAAQKDLMTSRTNAERSTEFVPLG